MRTLNLKACALDDGGKPWGKEHGGDNGGGGGTGGDGGDGGDGSSPASSDAYSDKRLCIHARLE